MSDMDPARQELRDLIAQKIDAMMRSERLDDHFDGGDYADALIELFYRVEDDWEEIDLSTLGEAPGSRVLAQRWLVARVPRESKDRNLAPDRTVSSESA